MLRSRRASLICLASWSVFFVLTATLPAYADDGRSGLSANTQGQAESEEASSSEVPPQSLRAYVIALPAEEGLEAIAQRVGARARATLRRIPWVRWEEADRRFLGYGEEQLLALQKAREQLEAGRKAYLDMDFQKAIALLTEAVSAFDIGAAALEDPHDLAEALLFLGASLVFEGKNREAQRIFARLHVQMPYVRPDPNLFSPDVIQRYESARPRGNPSSSITIASDPPRAIAYVDFLPRGLTPLTVPELFHGEHVVRVSRAGSVPAVQSISVGPRRTASISFTLPDVPGLEALGPALESVRTESLERMEPTSALRRVASMLDVERLGLIRVSKGSNPNEVQLELLVFDVATGRRLARGSGSVKSAVGELEPAVERLVAGTLETALKARIQEPVEPRKLAEEEKPPVLVTPPPSGPSIVEEPAFWLILGGILVAGGAATAVGVWLSSQGPPLGSSPQGQVVFEF
ncbi:MAG: PEGA domain-containing protein [Sandaracinaceae bacterium]|nr:PEGA domain-containing protein [Sandaracinaceae bacterium]